MVDGKPPKNESAADNASPPPPIINQNGVNVTLLRQRRMLERKEWDAYWKLKDIETKGTLFPRALYNVHRFFDAPVTWFRETIVEPLHDKHKIPYYHKSLSRVPTIDQCGVNDSACQFEANEQYRIDKLVDYSIHQILQRRLRACFAYYDFEKYHNCIQQIEDWEMADLNYFVKYGEMGSEADVVDVYMKQKHRLIWERRNPEKMAARQKAYEEYLEKKNNGEFDQSFWRLGLWFQDKKSYDYTYGMHKQKPNIEGDKPLSKDWQYYKRVAQDPEFDKEQGKQSNVTDFFPPVA